MVTSSNVKILKNLTDVYCMIMLILFGHRQEIFSEKRKDRKGEDQ